jgi:hypothetical protein
MDSFNRPIPKNYNTSMICFANANRSQFCKNQLAHAQKFGKLFCITKTQYNGGFDHVLQMGTKKGKEAGR